jgi:hypothetical protein
MREFAGPSWFHVRFDATGLSLPEAIWESATKVDMHLAHILKGSSEYQDHGGSNCICMVPIYLSLSVGSPQSRK